MKVCYLNMRIGGFDFSTLIYPNTYFGVFILASLAGHLIPIPEELILVTIGYTAAYQDLNIYLSIFFAIVGLLTGDLAYYALSRQGSDFVERHLLKRFSKEKVKEIRKRMHKHTGKTIFTLRFIMGVRFLAPLLAGATKVPVRKFVFYNTLALLIYVPVYVSIGYIFHHAIRNVMGNIQYLRWGVAILFGGVAVYYLLQDLKRRKSDS